MKSSVKVWTTRREFRWKIGAKNLARASITQSRQRERSSKGK